MTTRFLADHERQDRPWSSDAAWAALYSAVAVAFILAWAYVPA
jgi:hypothetical protein